MIFGKEPLSFQKIEFIRCDLCESKDKDKLMKPYTLEYLAMQVVMNKYVKNEMLSGRGNYFQDMNLQRKWNTWIFAFYCSKREVKKREREHDYGRYYFGLENVKTTSLETHMFSLMILRLLENPRYYIKNKTVDEKRELQKFCIYCHSGKCTKCGWLKKTPKWKKNLRFSGHLSKCPENY